MSALKKLKSFGLLGPHSVQLSIADVDEKDTGMSEAPRKGA